MRLAKVPSPGPGRAWGGTMGGPSPATLDLTLRAMVGRALSVSVLVGVREVGRMGPREGEGGQRYSGRRGRCTVSGAPKGGRWGQGRSSCAHGGLTRGACRCRARHAREGRGLAPPAVLCLDQQRKLLFLSVSGHTHTPPPPGLPGSAAAAAQGRVRLLSSPRTCTPTVSPLVTAAQRLLLLVLRASTPHTRRCWRLTSGPALPPGCVRTWAAGRSGLAARPVA